MEQWKAVVGFPEKTYEVSDLGNIRSWLQERSRCHCPDLAHKRLKEPRLLNPWRSQSISERRWDGTEHRMIHLKFNGKNRYVFVHRLILETFVGPCPPGKEGAHLNGDETDNRLENLVWATHKENSHHRYAHGTMPIGSKNPGAKITEDDVREIRRLAVAGMKQSEIARKFGIRRVDKIISRHPHGGWAHVK